MEIFMNLFDCFFSKVQVDDSSRQTGKSRDALRIVRAVDQSSDRIVSTPKTLKPPVSSKSSGYSDSELSKLVIEDPVEFERLLSERVIPVSRVKRLNYSFKHVLRHLIDNDPSALERLVIKRVIGVSDLLEMGGDRSNLMEALLSRSPRILCRWLEQGVVRERDLSRLVGRSKESILHRFAKNMPSELSYLVENQSLNPRAIAHISFSTNAHQSCSVVVYGSVLGILTVNHEDELLKWLVDYGWITMSDCQRQDAIVYNGRDHYTVSEWFEMKHRYSLEVAIRRRKEALKEVESYSRISVAQLSDY